MTEFIISVAIVWFLVSYLPTLSRLKTIETQVQYLMDELQKEHDRDLLKTMADEYIVKWNNLTEEEREAYREEG